MSFPRFLIVAVVALILAGGCLAIGAATDNTAISVAGIVFVLVVIGAREAWLWEGAGKLWLLMVGSIVAVVAFAFVVSKLFG
jgi:hypothetical protein